MQNKQSAALVFGALLIAVIAGVTGWSMRSSVATDDRPAFATAPSTSQVPGNRPTRLNPASMPTATMTMGTDPRSFVAANDKQVSKLVTAGKQRLQSRYEREAVDPSWASSKQKALLNASVAPQIEQLSAKPLAFDSRCRSTVCLIGADFSSVDASDDWFALYTMIAGPEMSNAAMERTQNPDGTIHLQIYGQAR